MGRVFPGPLKYGYFRLMRTLTVIVTAITMEIVIKKLIINLSFPPEGFPRPGPQAGDRVRDPRAVPSADSTPAGILSL